jgi:Peptidase family M3
MLHIPRSWGPNALHRPLKACARALACVALLACSAAHAQGIYTCVLPNGRKITADRPVPECAEREQKELNASGTLRRVVKPVMTAQEQAVADNKAREENEERLRQAEEKRKDRAMLSRYPNVAIHDIERNAAVGSVDDVIKAAAKRITELGAQRKLIDQELEFYKKDPSKVPASLKRQIDEYDTSVATQKQFIGTQELEKKRIHQRFDVELVRLKQLWALVGAPAVAPTSVARAPAATLPSAANKSASDPN